MSTADANIIANNGLPSNSANVTSVFWLEWWIACILNALLLAPISPFVGMNLAVSIAGGYDKIGNSSVTASLVVGVVLCGLLLGVVQWVILRHNFPSATLWMQASTVGSFLFGTLLASGGFTLFSAGVYGLFLPFCIGGPLLMVLGAALPLLVTRTWHKHRQLPNTAGLAKTG